MLVAMIALFLLVLAIVGLVALTAWVALVAAVLLMVLGVFAVTRYVQQISLTRRSGERLERGLSGMNEDLAVTDDAHTQISRHDIPLGEPERMAAPPTSEPDPPPRPTLRERRHRRPAAIARRAPYRVLKARLRLKSMRLQAPGARSSVDRALASGARGRKFESCRARLRFSVRGLTVESESHGSDRG